MDQYIKCNELQLCYQDLGDPSNEAILLIAGLGEQLGEWPDNFCKLLSERFRVIRYDNRDIGLSDKMPDQSYSLNDMAEDAFGLLNALEIDSAHIVGMSMGGMIAQILCAEHPERVLSLCLLMSSSGEAGLPGPTPAVHQAMIKKTDGTIESFVDNWVAGKLLIDSPAYPADITALREKAKANSQRSYHPAGYLRHLSAIAANGSRINYLKKIDCPCLVLHGTEDPLIPMQCGENLAQHIKGAKLELIDGMGHNLPQQLHPRLTQSIIENATQTSQ